MSNLRPSKVCPFPGELLGRISSIFSLRLNQDNYITIFIRKVFYKKTYSRYFNDFVPLSKLRYELPREPKCAAPYCMYMIKITTQPDTFCIIKIVTFPAGNLFSVRWNFFLIRPNIIRNNRRDSTVDSASIQNRLSAGYDSSWTDQTTGIHRSLVHTDGEWNFRLRGHDV